MNAFISDSVVMCPNWLWHPFVAIEMFGEALPCVGFAVAGIAVVLSVAVGFAVGYNESDRC